MEKWFLNLIESIIYLFSFKFKEKQIKAVDFVITQIEKGTHDKKLFPETSEWAWEIIDQVISSRSIHDIEDIIYAETRKILDIIDTSKSTFDEEGNIYWVRIIIAVDFSGKLEYNSKKSNIQKIEILRYLYERVFELST